MIYQHTQNITENKGKIENNAEKIGLNSAEINVHTLNIAENKDNIVSSITFYFIRFNTPQDKYLYVYIGKHE